MKSVEVAALYLRAMKRKGRSSPLQGSSAKRSRRSRSEEQQQVMPEHVLFEHILTRLPVKSLCRFKSVSKSWIAEISHPRFVRMHLQHSKENRRPLFLSLSRERVYNLDRIDMHTFTLDGSSHLLTQMMAPSSSSRSYPVVCNGLILMYSDLVINPITREVFSLPKSSRRNVSTPTNQAALCFVPSTNEYKVARLYYKDVNLEDGTFAMGFEFFTLGHDRSWRALPNNLNYLLSDDDAPVCFDGWSYWKINNHISISPYKSVFCLNMSKECVYRVLPPLPVRPGLRDPSRLLFTELNSHLCLCEFRGIGANRPYTDPYAIDLWTCLVSHTARVFWSGWTKSYSINIAQGIGYSVPLAVHNDKLLLSIKESNSLQYLDPRTNKLEEEILVEFANNSSSSRSDQQQDQDKFVFGYHTIPYIQSLLSPAAPIPSASSSSSSTSTSASASL